MTLPKISIVITSYLEDSKTYLDLCIKSIRNLDYPKELLEVIIVGRADYFPMYAGCKTTSPPLNIFYPPVGLNYGINFCSSSSEYFFVINDDTILTKNCLTELLKASHPSIGLLMPIGNDQQSRYAASVGVEPRGHKLHELLPCSDLLMNAKSIYPLAVTFHDTLCIYAFLISRKTWEQVGQFDESLIGQDDIDYTMRIRQHGLQNAIAFNALVYHFGGVSADKTFSPESRAKSIEIFRAKWA